MANTISFGYPIPSDDAFEIEDFNFEIDGVPVSNKDDDEPFSYYSSVSCRVSLKANLTQVLRESGFSSSDFPLVSLGVGLIWFSSATKQRGSASIQELQNGHNELELNLSGEILGGDLDVHVVVFLKENRLSDTDQLVPTESGTILWESPRHSINLEGEGARFTIAPRDFKKTNFEPSDAMWRIVFTAGLFSPAQSAVVVYINTGDSRAKAMLEKPNTKESKLWHQFLEIDVISQLLIHGATHAEQLQEITIEDEGSLGESINVLYNSLFPEQNPSTLLENIPLITATAQAFVMANRNN